MKNKALFLDRDGVIIQMYYDTTLGIVDTPLTPQQVTFVPHILSFLKTAQELGFLLIVISNQPGVALKKVSKKDFDSMEQKILSTLTKHDIKINHVYYCPHHPFAKIQKYKKACNCRKPNTQLIKKAISAYDVDIENSWLVGDSIFDIVAGTRMKLKTMLIARIQETEYLRIVEEQLGDIKPTVLVKDLKHATEILRTYE